MAAPKPSREALPAADALPAELRVVPSKQGTTSTLELEGEWGLGERDVARAAVERALNASPPPECLVLDLGRVSFIDSSGIHAVVTSAKRCAERNVHLVIIPGPPHVHRVFEICQLTTQLPFASQA